MFPQVAHHAERLAELHAWLVQADAPQSAHDVIPVLFRRTLDLHQTTFAMGEAIAHLHALEGRGLLRARTDADGVRRFEAAGA